MNIRRLQCFIVLAEELHFGRAAERLCLSQPPLTRHIQLLEEELGANLFFRDSRHVALTEVGKVFLADARRLLILLERACDTVRRVAAGELQTLRIGHSGSIMFCEPMRRIIPLLRARIVNIKFFEMNTITQYEALRDESIDLGLNAPFEIETPSEIVSRAIFREDLAVCRQVSDVPSQARTMKSLNGLPLIIYAPELRAGLHNKVMRLYKQAGVAPAGTIEVTQIGAVPILVSSGAGIAILPQSMAAMNWPGMAYDRLEAPDAIFEVHASSKQNGHIDICDLIAGFTGAV